MTNISPASALKKELIAAFKGVKFSVKTKNSNVNIEWRMEIGTAATEKAVTEICKKYETVERYGSSIDDTTWSTGYSIRIYPTYSQEREDWAIQGVINYKFADAEWDAIYKRFIQADGKEHYHATSLYHQYVLNGVASGLLDEYGNEPSEKRWYYEKLNPSQPIQIEEIEPEIETPIIPLGIFQVEKEVYIQANFPSQNKQNWIDDYRSQASNICQAKIVKIVHLSAKDYQTFLYSLMSNREWLAKEGGSSSHYISEKYGDDWDKLFNDELETKKWRRECYEVSVLVSDGNDYILVNPEGYNYARYVGLRYHATLEYILEKSNVNLSINLAVLENQIKLEPVPEQESAPAASIQPEGDKVVALEVEYRRAYDQYIETWREADALEVKATLKRQEAQVFHEKMKEVDAQIEAAKQAFATTQTQGILMANSEQIYIKDTEISIEQAKKIADEGLNELFGNRHKLKQQFLTINKLLADTNGMKFGRTLINRESVLRLVIYWKGEKAILEWTAGGWSEGWKIIPFRETADGGCMELKEHRGQQYQTKAVDADSELRGAWAGFNLFQRLKDSGIDVTDW